MSLDTQLAKEDILLLIKRKVSDEPELFTIARPDNSSLTVYEARLVAFRMAARALNAEGKPTIAGFSIIKRRSSIVEGKTVTREEVLVPQGYFGDYKAVTDENEKRNGFLFAADTITGERVLLAPGELVWKLQDSRKPSLIAPKV